MNNVHYVDSDKVLIRFSTLVIDVSSLNGNQVTVAEFVNQQKINCITNGKLLLVYEMRSDFSYLIELVNSYIEPQGLRNNVEYSFIQEQLTIGVDNREQFDVIGSELPETQNLDWLSSEITEEGCFVWKTKKEETKESMMKPKAIAV